MFSLGSQILDVTEFARNRGETFDPSRTGLDHLSFTVASHEDLDRWTRWLDAHDIERSPVTDHNVDVPPVRWRVTMFDLVDHDGIQLEFVFVPEMQLGTVTL